MPPAGFLEDEIEDGAFCQAFQASGLDEFAIFYLAVYRGDQRVAVEEYRGALPPGMAEVLHGLYMQTHRRAEVRFECVTAAYFENSVVNWFLGKCKALIEP
jgi:hypothetical protein